MARAKAGKVMRAARIASGNKFPSMTFGATVERDDVTAYVRLFEGMNNLVHAPLPWQESIAAAA